MIGIITKLISIATIAYPLYTSLDILTSLQTSFTTNKIASLTETVPLVRQDATKIQEAMSYWILLSLWLYFTQCEPIHSLIKILPLVSLLVLYIQIWLGFPLVPHPQSNKKVTGAFTIYHYYFDNDMKHMKELQSYYRSLFGMVGLCFCRGVSKFPALGQVLTIFNFDVKNYEAYFSLLAYGNQSLAARAEFSLHGTMNDWTKLWGIIPGWKPEEVTNVGIFKVIVNALAAPFGYNLYSECPLSQIVKSKTPSPAGSFDDFAFVNKRDLDDSANNISLSIPKRRIASDRFSSSSRKASATESEAEDASLTKDNDNDDERAGLLGPAKRVNSRSLSNSSGWFRSR